MHAPGEWAELRGVAYARSLEAEARRRLRGLALAGSALVAALLPAIYPLAPSDTDARVVGAVVAAAVAVAVVAAVARRARAGGLVTAAALLSAGAAAIHFAVAKGHFAEYALFGVFFVLSGIAQLVWALLVLLRPSRALLALGAAGNVVIAAVWAVDRLWGLPLGPEHWKPESVGFADVTASAFEVLLALACIALVAATRERRPQVLAITVIVIALTALSLLSAVGVGAPLITPSA